MRDIMRQIKDRSAGILLCLAIAVPAWLLGKWQPVIGGPVFAILIGMCLSLIIKRDEALQTGVKIHQRKFCSMQ